MKKKTCNQQYCATQAGWLQEWVRPPNFRGNEDIEIREVVPGPFSSPKLIKISPIVTVKPYNIKNPCTTISKEATRRGIPDPWAECLALKGFCNKKDCLILKKNFVPCCIRLKLTKIIWNDLGLPLVQGIPDPSKSTSLLQNKKLKCRTIRVDNNTRNVRECNRFQCDISRELGRSKRLNYRKTAQKKHQVINGSEQNNDFEISARLTPRNFISIKVDKPHSRSERSKKKVKKSKSNNINGLGIDENRKKSLNDKKVEYFNDQKEKFHRKSNQENPTGAISERPCYCEQSIMQEETTFAHNKGFQKQGEYFATKNDLAQLYAQMNLQVSSITQKLDELKFVCCKCSCPHFKMIYKSLDSLLEHACPHCINAIIKQQHAIQNDTLKREDERKSCARRSEDRKNEVKSMKLPNVNNEIRIPTRRSKQALYSNGVNDTGNARICALNSRHECVTNTNVAKPVNKEIRFAGENIHDHQSINKSIKINNCSSSHSSSTASAYEGMNGKDSLSVVRSSNVKHSEGATSDSGDCADISDVSRNSDICGHKATAVTSMTLIELLNNSMTLTSGRKGSRKTQPDQYWDCKCVNERSSDDDYSGRKSYGIKHVFL